MICVTRSVTKQICLWIGVFLIVFLCFGTHMSDSACAVGDMTVIDSNDATVGDYFAKSVKYHDRVLAVGANDDDELGDNAGAVYIYQESIVGLFDFVFVGKIFADTPSPTWLRFGSEVALGDQSLAVCAYYDDHPDDVLHSGGVWVYRETTLGQADYAFVTKLDSPRPREEGWFGIAMEMKGSVLFVGAPYNDFETKENVGFVAVYQELNPGTGDFNMTQLLDPPVAIATMQFGFNIRVAGDIMAIAAVKDTERGYLSGAVYIYSDTTPGLHDYDFLVKLVGSDTAANDWIGYGLAIDDSTLVAGAWFESEEAYRAGAAYVFRESVSGLGDFTEVVKLVAPDAQADAWFGMYVDVRGTVAAVGAPKSDSADGAVYLFQESELGAGDWAFVIKMVGEGSEEIGDGVIIADDRLSVIISASAYDSDTGRVYIKGYDCEDQCLDNPMCADGFPCQDAIHKYECLCSSPISGALCDECLCESGGQCVFEATTTQYVCDCTIANNVGALCDGQNCNEGFLQDGSCNCTGSGATGKFCNLDVDDCASSPCENGGTCLDLGSIDFPALKNQFNCSCFDEYMGATCSDTLCFSSPCLNNGTCLNGVDSRCNCTETGYEGDFCQFEIDECASSPCLNQGTCVDMLGGYLCVCTGTGFHGWNCSDDTDDCVSSPCMNDGSCTDKGAYKFECKCAGTGFEGNLCQTDVDDCLSSPCMNDGLCTNDDAPNSFSCDCNGTGFAGNLCQIDVDDCLSSPCMNDGLCTNDDAPNSFSCDCNGTGFAGAVCEFDADDCASSPCVNNGTCTDAGLHLFQCICASGYTGSCCNQDLDDCLSNPCQNEGTCVDVGSNAFECKCPSTHSGDLCETLLTQTETSAPTAYDHPPVQILLTIPAFVNDTAESFAVELRQTILPEALGGAPSDYEITIIQQGDGSYEVSIVTTNPSERDGKDIEERIAENPDITRRVNGDIKIQVLEEEEARGDDDKSGDTGDLLAVIYVLVVLNSCAAVFFFFRKYHRPSNAKFVMPT